MSASALQSLEEARILPVASIAKADDGPRLAEALLEAGLNVAEITLRTGAGLDGLKAMRERFPDICLGAGTVLSADQMRAAADAGVDFAVAPGLDESVLGAARVAGVLFLPGVVTPTEITRALALDVRVLKFFPAEPAGGVTLLKALAGPFAHAGVRFVPTGGIGREGLGGYLKLPAVVAVGGSWFVPGEAVRAGDFAEVTRLTREALATAHAVTRSA